MFIKIPDLNKPMSVSTRIQWIILALLQDGLILYMLVAGAFFLASQLIYIEVTSELVLSVAGSLFMLKLLSMAKKVYDEMGARKSLKDLMKKDIKLSKNLEEFGLTPDDLPDNFDEARKKISNVVETLMDKQEPLYKHRVLNFSNPDIRYEIPVLIKIPHGVYKDNSELQTIIEIVLEKELGPYEITVKAKEDQKNQKDT